MAVLVVEDNPSVASLLQRGLERDGYSVDVAVDGNEALALGLENTYVAIVLDVMIPEPDGLAVARQLRKHGSWVPILMLTARDRIEDRIAGRCSTRWPGRGGRRHRCPTASACRRWSVPPWVVRRSTSRPSCRRTQPTATTTRIPRPSA